MAAPVWRKFLSNHPVFDQLHRHRIALNHANYLKNILAVYDNVLYVWNESESCVESINLLSFGSKVQKPTSSQSSESGQPPAKKLLCTDPPVFPVRGLLFSASGCHLALVGHKGVTVLEIPRRLGPDRKNNNTLCRAIALGERRLNRHNLRVLDVSWHPACETESVVVVLTSDGKISFYDIREPIEPIQEITLSEDISPSNYTTDCPSAFDIALGDIPVAFDFGQPMSLPQKNRLSTGGEIGYPIFVLWGNGNIHMIVTGLTTHWLTRPMLIGPLTMLPQADDNYGTDACSLICLKTEPTLLVVATCSGQLYHCVLLDREGDQTTDSLSTSGSLTQLSSSTLSPSIGEPVLYVYEKVELELSLTTVLVQDNSRIEDDFYCHIRLHKDPASPLRYHCSHGAGLHSVILPWMKEMERFCAADMTSSSLDLETGEQAIIEHLVCTKPLTSSPPSPIQGLCVVCDGGLGTSLIALTDALRCIVLPMRCRCKSEPGPLVSKNASFPLQSPLLAIRKETFSKHIKQILARSSSNPLLIAPAKSELTAQECFQLLTRATQVFREEYISKQDLAKGEIDKRVRLLTNQKYQQLEDLENIDESKVELIENAQNLADRYNRLDETQKDICERVETVLLRVRSRLPVLSDAEKKMSREILEMENTIQSLKIQLDQIKSKQKYQPKMGTDTLRLSRLSNSPRSNTISTSQIQKLKSLLKDEGDVISENMRRLKLVKAQLGI